MPSPTTNALRVEPTAKRVRAVYAGDTVADSTDVKLVWEKPYYPTYYFPATDVDLDAIPGRLVREHREVPGHVRLRWGEMDAWFEEDEEVFVHAKDPYKRIDILRSSRHVRVEVDGVTIADSRRPTLLFETGLPVRYYLPKTDVRMDLLVPTDTETRCPYKGTASYYAVEVDGRRHDDLVWWYPTTVHESARIAGLVCFYNEKVDLYVDEVLQGRPDSPFA